MISIEEPFHKYKDAVYRLALSYTKSTADAEDVCQSVFLKMGDIGRQIIYMGIQGKIGEGNEKIHRK